MDKPFFLSLSLSLVNYSKFMSVFIYILIGNGLFAVPCVISIICIFRRFTVFGVVIISRIFSVFRTVTQTIYVRVTIFLSGLVSVLAGIRKLVTSNNIIVFGSYNIFYYICLTVQVITIVRFFLYRRILCIVIVVYISVIFLVKHSLHKLSANGCCSC